MNKYCQNKFLKYYKTIIIFGLVALIFSAGFLSSCKFDNLGLSSDSQSSDENAERQFTEDSGFIFTEQYFFESRLKQADKNPLSDINVRKAIFYAVDRKRIASVLLNDYGGVLDSLFNAQSIYYSPAWNIYSYDPQKAENFLKDAGYSKNNPLFLTIGFGRDSFARQQIGEIIKENLAQIGINVWISEIESREWYVDYTRAGNYDIGLWSIHISDFHMLQNYFSAEKIPPMETELNKNCNNFYWYENEEFDNNFNTLIRETVPEKRVEYVKNIQDILAKDAFVLPLYSRVFAVAYNSIITGIEIDTSSGDFLINIINMDITNKEEKSTVSNQQDNKSQTEENVKSITVGYAQEPFFLNPMIPDNIYRDFINSLIIKGLWIKNDLDEYEPFLVESVIAGSGDGTPKEDIRYSLKATVRLKENIFWQDGSIINANDIVSTVNAIKEDAALQNSGLDYDLIKNIEALNSRELLITFNEYSENWMDLFNIIFPEKLINGSSNADDKKELSSLFSENIFGYGPYKLKEWIKGEYILLERNEYYAGKKPEIREIKFIFNSDINFLIAMLKEGQVDILNIPADLNLLQNIEEHKNLEIIVKPGSLLEHLAICLKPKQ